MTITSSGVITAQNISSELGRSTTASMDFNNIRIRQLANKMSAYGVPTYGSQLLFSDFYGKSKSRSNTISNISGDVGQRNYFGTTPGWTHPEWTSLGSGSYRFVPWHIIDGGWHAGYTSVQSYSLDIRIDNTGYLLADDWTLTYIDLDINISNVDGGCTFDLFYIPFALNPSYSIGSNYTNPGTQQNNTGLSGTGTKYWSNSASGWGRAQSDIISTTNCFSLIASIYGTTVGTLYGIDVNLSSSSQTVNCEIPAT